VNLSKIRLALADQITAGTGLRCEAEPRDQVSPPVVLVLPGAPFITYADSMQGTTQLTLTLLVVVSDAAPLPASQARLDALLGIGAGEEQSIAGSLAIDPTLGGAVHWCVPVSVTQYGRIQVGGVGMFGAHLNLALGGAG
jgi:hypothetical protein